VHSGDRALMGARACILGCEGFSLSREEARFFAQADPWGFILFARNIDTPDQIRALTADLRAAVGRDAPVLIDQEGGRVARLRGPHWREWLAPLAQMQQLVPGDRRQVMALRYRLIAQDLRALGIDVNCAPMLDIAGPTTHAIIRNRCYGSTPDAVAEAGRAVSEGLLAGGVLPVIKHIPGHGRAVMDSHEELPVLDTPLQVLQADDFLPFARLADLPMAMTAHIVFSAIDPENCATLSPAVIGLIRDNIGFDGLLMTDDLSMKALSGSLGARAGKALAAGCDMILHCNGKRDEMSEVVAQTPMLQHRALARAKAALAMRHAPEPFDAKAATQKLADLVAGLADA
jgi:beta-N-acetylhexosaminidase